MIAKNFRLPIFSLLILFSSLITSTRNANAQQYKADLEEGKEAWKSGRYAEADKAFTSALAKANQAFGADSDRIAIAIWKMKSMNSLGRLSDALKLGDQIRKQPSLSLDAAAFSQAALELGTAQLGLGAYDEAENSFLEGLKTAESLPGSEASVAVASVGLAEVYMRRGDFTKAEQETKKAIEVEKDAADSRQKAAAMICLGDLRRVQARYKDAEDSYSQARQVATNVGGEQQPEMAAAEVGLAEVLLTEGRAQDALKLLDEARNKYCGFLTSSSVFLWLEDVRGRAELSLRDIKNAASHLSIAQKERDADQFGDRFSSLISMGVLNTITLQVEIANKQFQEAEVGIRQSLGVNAPELALALIQFASLKRVQRKLVEAQQLLAEAAQIQSKFLANDSLPVIDRKAEEAFILREQGHFENAETLCREVISVQKRVLPPADLKRMVVEAQLGLTLIALGRSKDAEPLLRSWLTAEKNLPDFATDPQLPTVQFSLATSLYSQGKYAEAIPYFIPSMEHLSESDASIAWQELGDCYLQANNSEEAAKAYGRAIALADHFSGSNARKRALTFSVARAYLAVSNLDAADLYGQQWLRDRGNGTLNQQELVFVSSLAKALFDSKRYQNAEPFLKLLVTISDLSDNSLSNPDAVILQLAETYEKEGKDADAADLFERHGERLLSNNADGAESSFVKALTLQERANGSDSPLIVPSLQAVALLQIRRGKYEDAAQLLLRARSINDSSNPPNPLFTAIDFNQQGMICQQKQQEAEASSFYEKASRAIESVRNPPLEAIASIYFNRGSLAFESNKLTVADEYFSRVKSLFNATRHDEGLPVEQLDEIAELYLREKHYDDSEALYKKSLELRTRNFGTGSSQRAWGLYNLARFYGARFDFARATDFGNQSLELFNRDSDLKNQAYSLYIWLASIYDSAGKLQDAVRTREDLLKADQAVHRLSKTDLQSLLSELGQDYRSLKDYTNALNAYQRLVTLWQAEGFGNPNYRSAMRNLVIALEQVGQHDEASKEFNSLRKVLHEKFPGEQKKLIGQYAEALRAQGFTKQADKLAAEAISSQ